MIIKSYSQLHEWVANTQKTQSMIKVLDNKSNSDNSVKIFYSKNTLPQFRYQGKNNNNNTNNNLGAVPKQYNMSHKQSNDQNRQNSQTNSLTISPTINLNNQTINLIINPIGKFKINLRTNQTDSIKPSQIKDSLIISKIRDKQMDNVSQTSIIIIGDSLISLTAFYVQDVEDRITSAKTVKRKSI